MLVYGLATCTVALGTETGAGLSGPQGPRATQNPITSMSSIAKFMRSYPNWQQGVG